MRPKHKTQPADILPYEQRLDADVHAALLEGSMHFEKESAVHKALERIARRLDELGVPYAIAGGMALFFHGYRRFTEDVDILVSRDGLRAIHEALEGLGYVAPFEGSKNLRDAQSGVRIEFLISGGYPGDGKPKPVSFPDPAEASQTIEGVRVLSLPQLIQLKLASGTASGRRRDLGDVQELIRLLELPLTFDQELDSSVRDLYRELWREIQEAPPPPDAG